MVLNRVSMLPDLARAGAPPRVPSHCRGAQPLAARGGPARARGGAAARGRASRCRRRHRHALGSVDAMAIRSDTLQVNGVRCEKCIGRLAGVLRTHEGLVEANATLMG